MIRYVTVLLLYLFSFPLYAQQLKLEIIPLNHSTTDTVVPVIRPLLAPGGSISGMNNQLIVKTTPDNLVEIKQLLETLDRPLRSLMITVQQGIDRSEYLQGGAVSGTIGSGNVTLNNRTGQPSPGGVVLSGSDSNGNVIQYNGSNTQNNNTSNNTYSVQTLEGEPAYIQTGQSVPVPNRNTVITRNGVVIQDGMEYRDASSGFYVLPRVNGRNVTLMVAPRQSSVNPGRVPTFDIQSVQTTVTGRLGEWIQIGGLDQSSSANRQIPGGSNSRQVDELRSVLIKVEEIR